MKYLAAILVLVATIVAPPASAATTYTAPYPVGPTGGDSFNRVIVDAAAGRITIIRYNPIPGAFNCAGAGGYARFRLSHLVTEPITQISIDFNETALDAYTWVIANATQGANWFGSLEQRGPLVGEGTLIIPLALPGPEIGKTLTFDFGLQVASACPNVNGGTVRFTGVTLS